MNPTLKRLATNLANRHRLPQSLWYQIASIVPADHPDPAQYLYEHFSNPTHATLVPYLGNAEALFPRLLVLISRITRDDELVSVGLRALRRIIESLHPEVRNIRSYVFVSLKRAIDRERSRTRLIQLPENEPAKPAKWRSGALVSEQQLYEAEYRGLRLPVNTEVTESDKARAAQLYLGFYRIGCDNLQQQILEARWSPALYHAQCRYADEVAEILGLPLEVVMRELESMQRRFLEMVNAFRASRNNKHYPALGPRPIQRVHRPLTIKDLENKTNDPSILGASRPSHRGKVPEAGVA